MNFMRKPKTGQVPVGVADAWRRIQVRTDDPGLAEERIQTGHMLAWYWDTVARWMMMRARRGAQTGASPLPRAGCRRILAPAARRPDREAHGPGQPGHGWRDARHAAAAFGHANPLLEHLDLKRKVVKDAEGEILHVAVNPLGEEE
eukprot:1843353-Pyramimonas_sp.AAC.1